MANQRQVETTVYCQSETSWDTVYSQSETSRDHSLLPIRDKLIPLSHGRIWASANQTSVYIYLCNALTFSPGGPREPAWPWGRETGQKLESEGAVKQDISHQNIDVFKESASMLEKFGQKEQQRSLKICSHREAKGSRRSWKSWKSWESIISLKTIDQSENSV